MRISVGCSGTAVILLAALLCRGALADSARGRLMVTFFGSLGVSEQLSLPRSAVRITDG